MCVNNRCSYYGVDNVHLNKMLKKNIMLLEMEPMIL